MQNADTYHFNLYLLGSMFQLIHVIWNNLFYLGRESARWRWQFSQGRTK